MIGAPRTPAAEQFGRLVAQIAGIELSDPAPERRAKGLGGLFSRS